MGHLDHMRGPGPTVQPTIDDVGIMKIGDTLVTLTRVRPDCIRILLHDPGGLGFVSSSRSKQTLKMERLKKLLINHRFDYVGLTEVNKDWWKIEHENTIWGATTGWRQYRRVQVAQNTTKDSSNSDLLIGGVATMAFYNLVFRISRQESDFRKLGRW